MKIALFDVINEMHVCSSLSRALQGLGHHVHDTGRIWRGHRRAVAEADVARIDAAIDSVLAWGCEALLNFRAGALSERQVGRLREAGVRTAVWLPDDPVLHATTYGAVVDAYDHVLHCGPANVLRFYDAKGHAPGVTFPFWLCVRQWSWQWRRETATQELVFLGNLHGAAKLGRYELLAAAAGRIAVYGNCPVDPYGIHRGELHGPDALRAVLPRFTAGINLPQRFADYARTPYDFDGLADLGSFDLPSRVLQYAAVGLPVITISAHPPSAHFAPVLHATDMGMALEMLDQLRREPDAAGVLSADARAKVEAHFSAEARARFLIDLFRGALQPRKMDIAQREYTYQAYQGS